MSTKTAEERAAERFDYNIERMTWPLIMIDKHEQDVDVMRQGFATCIREVAEPLEADNAKLRALVQRLVNALGHLEVPRELFTDKVKAAVLAIDAAKEHGFVPTNTKQDNGN